MPDLIPSGEACLLAVLAHPDDESFGPGGTLAFYAHHGVKVHLLCATRGEVGQVAPQLLQGYASLGDLRQNELRCAASILGLASVEFLGYRDSGMPGSPDNHHPQALAAAPIDDVTAKIVSAIRRLHPQVVLTFDPIGGYQHPDHIATHEATRRAFHAAGDAQLFPGGLPAYAPQKLYYHTFARRALRLLVTLMRLLGRDPSRWGKNGDIDLAAIAAVDFPVHAAIDVRSVADLKARASACHASQGGVGGGRTGRWMAKLLGGRETFMRAQPAVTGRLRERDLFAGVRR